MLPRTKLQQHVIVHLSLPNIHGTPSFPSTPFRSPILITEITLFVLDLDCSDSNQIHERQTHLQAINDLLNTGSCPDNVTLVQDTHFQGKGISQIGLCPFELVVNYVAERKPEVIIEAKCKNCSNKKCSRRNHAKCEELTVQKTVKYSNGSRSTMPIAVGCFCLTRSSTLAAAIPPPYQRRRRGV